MTRAWACIAARPWRDFIDIGSSIFLSGISAAVNVASRIEHLTKEYESPILITEKSYRLLKRPEEYPLQKVGDIPTRGKREKVPLYGLCNSS